MPRAADNTAYHAAIILKMGVLIAVAENYVRSAVRTDLIGRMEETAKRQLKA
jgi:hypothetical protein